MDSLLDSEHAADDAGVKLLRRRIRDFQDRKWSGKSFFSSVLDSQAVKDQGLRVAIFGGFLRDLARRPVGNFSSDIDIVVAASSWDAFVELLRSSAGTFTPQGRTKWGGYRYIIGQHWQVDAWSLEETWAFRYGHVPDAAIEHLIETTFFSWDAIALDLSSMRLHYRPGYFSNLQRCYLDINLPASPNPVGNAIRTLRYLLNCNATISVALVQHVVANTNPEILVEASPKDRVFLESESVQRLLYHLKEHLNHHPTEPFKAGQFYLSLP